MNRYARRIAAMPWSLFVPVALAVMVGALAADAIGQALFGDQDAGAMPVVAAVSAEAATAAATEAAPARRPLPVLQPVRLPGPATARRDGARRACISGTVALRAPNGWAQEVVADAPARCRATSP